MRLNVCPTRYVSALPIIMVKWTRFRPNLSYHGNLIIPYLHGQTKQTTIKQTCKQRISIWYTYNVCTLLNSHKDLFNNVQGWSLKAGYNSLENHRIDKLLFSKVIFGHVLLYTLFAEKDCNGYFFAFTNMVRHHWTYKCCLVSILCGHNCVCIYA